MAANTQLITIHNNLEKLIDSKKDAMPQGFNKTRFIQNCMTVLQDTYGIEKCEPTTVARTLLKGAFLGLDFFNKECYAIPYGASMNFQTDYKGERKLAKKYSVRKVKDIYAKLVRAGDVFEENITDGQQTIQFAPVPFNNGDIVGAFAVVLFHDGGMLYETMSIAEMEHVKENYSKKSKDTGKFSKAWEVSTGEMYKKTVLRRLCKNIELDFDTIEQARAFEDAADVDFNKKTAPQQTSPLNVVDAEYEVVNDGSTTEAQSE
ncbi:RecT family recombinase [Paenibacillus sp. MMO-58]|uniref:RecT family recombinase n=1 Tax=Paenibacillus sp. MMO-58 TaxID=3081290 RepID=UPI003017ED3D